jgi:hypothetical protein
MYMAHINRDTDPTGDPTTTLPAQPRQNTSATGAQGVQF